MHIRAGYRARDRPQSERTTMRPDVSIILPIYNTARYLEQCLQSIAEQTLENIEVICVDDGSTDESPSIMDRFAERDDRFVVVRKENGGYGKAVNVGIEHAHGAYVGIVEPDDYIDVRMYQTLLDAAERHDCPDIVKSAYWRVCDADTPNEHLLPANYLHCMKAVDSPFVLADDAEFLFHHPSIWSAVYSRAFLDEFGIRMHEIPGAGWADNPWLIETLAQARSIVYVDECLYYYREFNLGSSSIVRDPSIIYDRWLDMDEIIKRLHITAPRIIEGHYNRGCAYIEMLNQDFDTNDPRIKNAIARMTKRMDYATIMDSEKIPPFYKDAYRVHVNKMTRGFYRLARKLKG